MSSTAPIQMADMSRDAPPQGLRRRKPGQETGPYADLPPEEREALMRLHARATRRTLFDHLQQWAWILGAAFVLYFGDGRRPLPAVLANDPRIRQGWLSIFCFGVGANFLLFLYTAYWLRWTGKCLPGQDYEDVAPWAIPTAVVMGLVSFVAAHVAAWPVWGFLCIPMCIILYMGFFMATLLIPGGAEDPAAPGRPPPRGGAAGKQE
ncbi:unnamed protein product [Pedinophyceae sp. YPF-701]|nr:unnamed protein product [Pedinophyceae sp. YPF-701]